MKVTVRNVYTCSYCSSYYLQLHHASYHEQFCKHNPNNRHSCFEGCIHLSMSSSPTEYGSVKSFTCNAQKGKQLYSYKAERTQRKYKKHSYIDISDAERMPLSCNYLQLEQV